MPQLAAGLPFEEFFDDYLQDRRGGGPRAVTRAATERRHAAAQDQFTRLRLHRRYSGIVVTNNHVIADADEINVIMNDGHQDQGRTGRRRQEDRYRGF